VPPTPAHFGRYAGSLRYPLQYLVLLKVRLAYEQVPSLIMLTILVGLSIIKVAPIIAYFMHMKFERLSLFLTLFPMLIFCIVLMLIFLGDATRIPVMRPPV
jgi:cytochrome c oxidase subunit IV